MAIQKQHSWNNGSHCLLLEKHTINLLIALGELTVHGSCRSGDNCLVEDKSPSYPWIKAEVFVQLELGDDTLTLAHQLLPPTAHSKPAAPSSSGEPAGAAQHAASHCSSLPQSAGTEWELAGLPEELYFVLHYAVSYSFPVRMVWIHKTIYSEQVAVWCCSKCSV